MGLHLSILWLLIIACNLVETVGTHIDDYGKLRKAWTDIKWYVPTSAAIMVWVVGEIAWWVLWFLAHIK